MRVSVAMMSGVELVSLDVDPSLQLSHVLALLPDQADARSRSRRLLLGEVPLTLHGGGTLRGGERTSVLCLFFFVSRLSNGSQCSMF